SASCSAAQNETLEYYADRGSAPRTAGTQALHRCGKSRAPPRNHSRLRLPSGDPKPLECSGLHSLSSLTFQCRACYCTENGHAWARIKCPLRSDSAVPSTSGVGLLRLNEQSPGDHL